MKTTLPPLATKKETTSKKPVVTVRASTNLTVPATLKSGKTTVTSKRPVPGKITGSRNDGRGNVVGGKAAKAPGVAVKGKVTRGIQKKQQVNPIKATEMRIRALKQIQRDLELKNTSLRSQWRETEGKIKQQTAILSALDGQIEAGNVRLSYVISETAKNMIIHDEFTEKVRVAKVAAMNAYGTLTVVHRDLRAVIEATGPDSSTPDVMEALMNGELNLVVDEPHGEVSKMVEGLIGEEDNDFPTVKTVANAEGTDLGLIPEEGEEPISITTESPADFFTKLESPFDEEEPEHDLLQVAENAVESQFTDEIPFGEIIEQKIGKAQQAVAKLEQEINEETNSLANENER